MLSCIWWTLYCAIAAINTTVSLQCALFYLFRSSLLFKSASFIIREPHKIKKPHLCVRWFYVGAARFELTILARNAPRYNRSLIFAPKSARNRAAPLDFILRSSTIDSDLVSAVATQTVCQGAQAFMDFVSPLLCSRSLFVKS